MKPEQFFYELIDTISTAANVKTGRDRLIIPLDNQKEPVTFILHAGAAAIYSAKTHLLLSHIQAPFIIGINFLTDENLSIVLHAKGEIRYEVAIRSQCVELIDKKGLWKHVAYIYMFYTREFLTSYCTSAGSSSYELIRHNLEELMNCPPEVRLRTNACYFIHDKTKLSRSGIMKILKDLKEGGYIDIHRGILIQINNTLPYHY